MSESVTLIMKATRLCNLRCDYCYDWRAEKNQIMSFEVLAHTIARVLRHQEHRVVEFVWHGGEPTLLGMEFFERAMLLQARFRRTGQIVRNTIQTNATRVDGEWADFLARHDFEVGVSIDGPEAIHDRTRLYANGKPSWSDVRTGLRTLVDRGVNVGVLMVVDRPVLDLGPRRVVDFFIAEDIKAYGLLAAKPASQVERTPGEATPHYVTPREMSEFLIGVDECLAAHGDPDIQVRELEALRTKIRGSGRRHCTLSGFCVGKYFVVEPDGEVAHCDLFVGDPDYTLGNVLEDTFSDFRASSNATNLRRRNEREVAAMSSCSGFDICAGWCPHERYSAVRHDPEYDPSCCGQKTLIEHLIAREQAAPSVTRTSVQIAERRPGSIPTRDRFEDLSGSSNINEETRT